MENLCEKDAAIRNAIKELAEKRELEIMNFELKLKEGGVSIVEAVEFEPGGCAAVVFDWENTSAELIAKFSGEQAICFVVKTRLVCSVDRNVSVYMACYTLLGKSGNVIARNKMFDLDDIYSRFPGEELFVTGNEGLDDDEDEDGYIVELSSDQLNALALLVARSDGFGGLKNARLRKDFAERFVSGIKFPKEWGNEWEHRNDEDIDDLDFYLSIDYAEIASRANNIYEYGLLPMNVAKMIEEGKSEKLICGELGITKAKLEKLKHAKPQDFALSAINKFHEVFTNNSTE